MVYRRVRPQKHEKVERNEEVRKCYRERPELTLNDIGVLFGVSRQRVFQIVKSTSCRM